MRRLRLLHLAAGDMEVSNLDPECCKIVFVDNQPTSSTPDLRHLRRLSTCSVDDKKR